MPQPETSRPSKGRRKKERSILDISVDALEGELKDSTAKVFIIGSGELAEASIDSGESQVERGSDLDGVVVFIDARNDDLNDPGVIPGLLVGVTTEGVLATGGNGSGGISSVAPGKSELVLDSDRSRLLILVLEESPSGDRPCGRREIGCIALGTAAGKYH